MHRSVTPDDAAALDGYVRRLNEVADKLAEKNRTLRKWHNLLAEKVGVQMQECVGGGARGRGTVPCCNTATGPCAVPLPQSALPCTKLPTPPPHYLYGTVPDCACPSLPSRR